MVAKNHRAGKPAPTPTRREANRRNTSKRQAAMEAKARREGWANASAMITAWLKDEAVVVKVNNAGA